ncbi:MAG: hypothetical protein AAF182_01065 [Pseudomonadota bacterium]
MKIQNRLFVLFSLVTALNMSDAKAQTSDNYEKLTGIDPSEKRLSGETIYEAELRLEQALGDRLLTKQDSLVKTPSTKKFAPNGKAHGTWTYRWENGKIARFEEYKNGEKDGPWKYYDEQGRRVGILLYKNDELVGAFGILRYKYRHDELLVRPENNDYRP